MQPHPAFQRVLSLMQIQGGSLQREFGHVLAGASLIANNVNYPNHPEETVNIRKGVRSLIEGALLVYLFAMWESHVPDDVSEWLTQDEQQKLNAYRHVRDSVAHKFQGHRADFKSRRTAFEALMPFDGIQWDPSADTIDLSNASVSHGCFGIMASATKALVSRLHQNQKP
jgi:hypothetical protein